MLVLSRKKNEKIVIQLGKHTVRVSVLAVDGKKIRLGVEAPDEVDIHREEVWNRLAEFAEDSMPTVL